MEYCRVAGSLFENFGMYVFSISFRFSHLYFYDTLFSFSFFLSLFFSFIVLAELLAFICPVSMDLNCFGKIEGQDLF